MEVTPNAPIAQPKIVRLAVALIYISLAIGATRFALRYNEMQEKMRLITDPRIVAVVAALTTSFLAFVGYSISRRKNWARIVYLVAFLLGLPSIVPLIKAMPSASPDPYFAILQVCITLTATLLLFQRDANAWFRAR